MGLPFSLAAQTSNASRFSSISGEFLFPRGEAMLNPNFLNQRFLIPTNIPMERLTNFYHNSAGQTLNEGLGFNLRFHSPLDDNSHWQKHFMLGYRWGEHYGWRASTLPSLSGDTSTVESWAIFENWDEFRLGWGWQRLYPIGKSRFSLAAGYTISLGVPVARNEVIVTRNILQSITIADSSSGNANSRQLSYDEERAVYGKQRFFSITHEIPLELHYSLSKHWSITGMMRFGLQQYIFRPDVGVITRNNFFSQPAFGIRYNFGR
jgi:hypothetical protein